MPSPRVVLITGASSGIGAAAARVFLNRGDQVHVAARRLEKMAALADSGARVHRLDLESGTSIDALADEVLAGSGRIDLLVNNAGIGVFGPVESVNIAEARRQFEVNLFGLAHLTRRFLPAMRESESGVIINVSSIGGLVHTPLGAWYHASKHALEGWSDCLRNEMAPFGVKVVIIEPGAIATEFAPIAMSPLQQVPDTSPYRSVSQKMVRATLRVLDSGKSGDPESVARLIEKVADHPRPAPRYLIGPYSRSLLWTRRVLGDRAYDALIRRFL